MEPTDLDADVADSAGGDDNKAGHFIRIRDLYGKRKKTPAEMWDKVFSDTESPSGWLERIAALMLAARGACKAWIALEHGISNHPCIPYFYQ